MSLPFILASASPRRAALLRQAGFDFSIVSSSVPEPGAFLAEDAALANAFKKAADVADRYPDALVLGADTVIEFQQKIYGKPRSMDEAFQMLKTFSGKTHFVTTGCALISKTENILVRFAEVTGVSFRDLPDDLIRTYLSRTDVLDKAGAYAIQENGDLLIEKIDGDRDNVIGLPVRASDAVRRILSCF